jgi:hypothetical protein
MNTQPSLRRAAWRWGFVAGSALLAVVASSLYVLRGSPPALPRVEPLPPVVEASPEQVQRACGTACHVYPPPATFPRFAWRKEVKQAYSFFHNSTLQSDFPPLESVVAYYESRAPEQLAFPEPDNAPGGPPLRFQRSGCAIPGEPLFPVVSHLNLVHLSDARKLDLLACDMRSGGVLLLKPYEASPSLRTLATLKHPAHVEVVDLDQDGVKDLLVAELGSFLPTDARVGSVVWLKGQPDGTYQPLTLLKDVGRVANVQAADFRGVGWLDLVVAVFGWRDIGALLYLRNETNDWSKPVFVPIVLDRRHGASHVCVTDLNADGRPDVVALLSQEHERVEAYLNEGNGQFQRQTIFAGPHPAYGCSGIQVVDLNGDGRPDVLLSNGDTLDPPLLVKPYHGVQWLENRGSFPFTHHHLTTLPGAMRAVAADFTGQGKLDILAVSLLPNEGDLKKDRGRLDSVILLEQTEAGRFVRHALERGQCDHAACAAGAWDGDGRVHFVTGNFLFTRSHPVAEAIQLWKNATTK